jgi:hypothetical protein
VRVDEEWRKEDPDYDFDEDDELEEEDELEDEMMDDDEMPPYGDEEDELEDEMEDEMEDEWAAGEDCYKDEAVYSDEEEQARTPMQSMPSERARGVSFS